MTLVFFSLAEKMAAQLPTFDELLKETVDSFEAQYHLKPLVGACAPGRVNLIGEHIDYCDGFVLPMVSIQLLISIKVQSMNVRSFKESVLIKIIDLSGSSNGHDDGGTKERYTKPLQHKHSLRGSRSTQTHSI